MTGTSPSPPEGLLVPGTVDARSDTKLKVESLRHPYIPRVYNTDGEPLHSRR